MRGEERKSVSQPIPNDHENHTHMPTTLEMLAVPFNPVETESVEERR